MKEAQPKVRSVGDLRQLIDSYPSAHEFMKATLCYNDKARAETLAGVVRWLEEVGNKSSLNDWAKNAKPNDYAGLRIRGFGLAGFQYLRMLFEANTIKPDIHICNFVVDCVGHHVSPTTALRLLERAAAPLDLSLRDLDTTIWEHRARANRA